MNKNVNKKGPFSEISEYLISIKYEIFTLKTGGYFSLHT